MMFVLLLTLNNIVSYVITNVIYDESTIYVEMCRFSVFALSWENKFGGHFGFVGEKSKPVKWFTCSDSEYVFVLLILIRYSYVLNVQTKVSVKVHGCLVG